MLSARHFAVFLMLAAVSLSAACGQDRDASGIPSTSHDAPTASNRIDINHASVEELLRVHGMTRSWAERIVRYRPYRAKTDLVEEGIVPPEVYRQIRDFIIAHRSAQ